MTLRNAGINFSSFQQVQGVSQNLKYRSRFYDFNNIPQGKNFFSNEKISDFSYTGDDASGNPGTNFHITNVACIDGATVYSEHLKHKDNLTDEMYISYEPEDSNKNNLFGSFYIADMSASFASEISLLLNKKSILYGHKTGNIFGELTSFDHLINYIVYKDGYVKLPAMEYTATYNAVLRGYQAKTGVGELLEFVTSLDELTAKALDWCSQKMEGLKLDEKNYDPLHKAYNPLLGFSAETKTVIAQAEKLWANVADNPLLKAPQEFIAEAYNYVKAILHRAGNWLYNQLPPAMQNLLTAIQSMVADISNLLGTIVQGMANLTTALLDGIGEALKLLNAFLCGIINGIIGLLQTILTLLGFVIDFAGPDFGYEDYLRRRNVGEQLESIIDFIKDTFGSICSAIKNLFTQNPGLTLQEIADFISKTGSFLNKQVTDFWNNTSRYQLAYYGGIFIFEVIINVLLAFATGGAGNIAKAGTNAEKIAAFAKLWVKEAFSVATLGIVDLLAFFRSIITAFVKACSKGLRSFFRWVEELMKGIKGDKAKNAEELLEDVEESVKRRYLASTIGGSPMDPILLNKFIKSFERQGGVVQIGGDTQRMLDARKVEGITYHEKLILLDEKASTSAVYEEFIHSAQFRTGKYDKWVGDYGNDVATYLMEKEAAEKLLSNATTWDIPQDEIKLIEERLIIFSEALKKLKL